VRRLQPQFKRFLRSCRVFFFQPVDWKLRQAGPCAYKAAGFGDSGGGKRFRDAVRIFSTGQGCLLSVAADAKKSLAGSGIVDHYDVISKANSLRLKAAIFPSPISYGQNGGHACESDLDNAQTAVEMAQAIWRWFCAGGQKSAIRAKEQWPEAKT